MGASSALGVWAPARAPPLAAPTVGSGAEAPVSGPSNGSLEEVGHASDGALRLCRLSGLEEGVAGPLTGPFLTGHGAHEDRTEGRQREKEGERERASLHALSSNALNYGRSEGPGV